MCGEVPFLLSIFCSPRASVLSSSRRLEGFTGNCCSSTRRTSCFLMLFAEKTCSLPSPEGMFCCFPPPSFSVFFFFFYRKRLPLSIRSFPAFLGSRNVAVRFPFFLPGRTFLSMCPRSVFFVTFLVQSGHWAVAADFPPRGGLLLFNFYYFFSDTSPFGLSNGFEPSGNRELRRFAFVSFRRGPPRRSPGFVTLCGGVFVRGC